MIDAYTGRRTERNALGMMQRNATPLSLMPLVRQPNNKRNKNQNQIQNNSVHLTTKHETGMCLARWPSKTRWLEARTHVLSSW